jgi:DNA polymerase
VADERNEDLEAAIGHLASALAGSLEELQATGLTWIPRPRPPSKTAAPAATPTPATAGPPAPPPRSERPAAPPSADDVLPLYQPGGLAETDAAIAALLQKDAPAAARLAELEQEIVGPCQRCKLNRGRSKLVFGVGNPQADLVFVGEGPGGEEDRQGIPFVGKAGQLLTKMIGAMGFERDDVYICNVVKCRPPNNRDPEPDEVDACERFLKAQLAVVQPKVVVTLGRYAAQCLLRTKRPISRLRGEWFQYEGIDLMPTFHPAYLLRSPEKKREAWADLQDVMKRFGKSPAKNPKN